MTRRIGALGIALRNLCEAIERDDGVDMTPLWERAKAVLENNTIVTEPVDTPAATEGLPDAQAARIAQLETTLADATEALQKAPVRPATYHWERHAEERRELIRRCPGE